MLVTMTCKMLHPIICPQHGIPQTHCKGKRNLPFLFWRSERGDIYRRFGTTCRSDLQGTWSLTIEDGTETSVNKQSTPRNIPEQRRCHLRRGASPKSRSEPCYVVVGTTSFGKIWSRMRVAWSSCWRKYNPSVHGFYCSCLDNRYNKSFALTGCISFIIYE
jgi:hypothetical protein